MVAVVGWWKHLQERKRTNEDEDKNKSIIGQTKETRRERSGSNQMMMNSRNDDGGDNELVDKNEKIEEEEKKTEVSKVMVVPLVKGKETKKSAVLRPAPAPPLDEPDILTCTHLNWFCKD